jgi:hypothetical protein
MLKFMAFAVAGMLTIVIVKRVMDALNASRAQVKARPPGDVARVRSLRQDPKTGVYFPED